MKRLSIVLMVLALMATTAGMAFAGVDWDGDPNLAVGGTKVHVSFSIDGGAFVRAGGEINLTATAPQLRLLGRGPVYITTQVVATGEAGHLLLTTNLSGAQVPDKFVVRVRVPNKGVDERFTVSNGETVDFVVPN